jgi:hypothetical protein
MPKMPGLTSRPARSAAAVAATSRVNSASLPIATPSALTPISCPQHQYGDEPRCGIVSGMSFIST